jgi:polyhydroxybutyrate depolymerase
MKRKIGIILSLAIILMLFVVIVRCHKIKNANEMTESQVNLDAGDYDFSLENGGLQRVYKVHVPPSYDQKSPMPAILNLHGGGGNSDGQISISQMNMTADKDGFIVIYPDGTGKKTMGEAFETWNSGTCCGSAKDNNVDDVSFLSQVISETEGKFNIDKKRIFVAGYSNGAMMAMKLACEISDRVAAIATIASTQAIPDCHLARPVPMIHFHGTKDNCHYYNGGMCGGCFADLFHSIGLPLKKDEYACGSAQSDIDNWRIQNNCSNESEIVFQKGSTQCVSYDQCKGNGEVEFCTMNGAGHIWPGGKSYAIDSCESNPTGHACTRWKEIIGLESNDINANDAMWEFFQKHSAPNRKLMN